jgi:hypothetical protein
VIEAALFIAFAIFLVAAFLLDEDDAHADAKRRNGR